MSDRGGPQRIPRPPGVRTGREAPWAALPPSDRHVDVDRVRAAFAGRPAPDRSPLERFGARSSAVLAALYDDAGEAHVVLTRRAQHLRSHRGEVSFPGGGQDKGETPQEAAIREAHEETGLDPSVVEIVGELDHLSTLSSRSSIAPFVAVLAGRPVLHPNEAEVERILHVPLSELLLEEVYREERWGVPPLDRSMHFFELVGDTIWGATARMLYQLLAIVTGTEPPRRDG